MCDGGERYQHNHHDPAWVQQHFGQRATGNGKPGVDQALKFKPKVPLALDSIGLSALFFRLLPEFFHTGVPPATEAVVVVTEFVFLVVVLVVVLSQVKGRQRCQFGVDGGEAP